VIQLEADPVGLEFDCSLGRCCSPIPSGWSSTAHLAAAAARSRRVATSPPPIFPLQPGQIGLQLHRAAVSCSNPTLSAYKAPTLFCLHRF